MIRHKKEGVFTFLLESMTVWLTGWFAADHGGQTSTKSLVLSQLVCPSEFVKERFVWGYASMSAGGGLGLHGSWWMLLWHFCSGWAERSTAASFVQSCGYNPLLGKRLTSSRLSAFYFKTNKWQKLSDHRAGIVLELVVLYLTWSKQSVLVALTCKRREVWLLFWWTVEILSLLRFDSSLIRFGFGSFVWKKAGGWLCDWLQEFTDCLLMGFCERSVNRKAGGGCFFTWNLR